MVHMQVCFTRHKLNITLSTNDHGALHACRRRYFVPGTSKNGMQPHQKSFEAFRRRQVCREAQPALRADARADARAENVGRLGS